MQQVLVESGCWAASHLELDDMARDEQLRADQAEAEQTVAFLQQFYLIVVTQMNLIWRDNLWLCEIE